MALVTKTFPNSNVAVTNVFSDESASGAGLTVTTSSFNGRPFRLDSIHVRYSASTTKTVTVTKDSGKGAAYDEDLGDISVSTSVEGGARFGDDGFRFAGDDQIVIVAPLLAANTVSIEVVQTAL